jgi:hypothetical protein
MLRKIFLIFSILALIFLFTGQSALAKNDNLKLKVFIHYPKEPGKPAVVSNCTVTSNDQINDWLWAGWQMPSGGVDYKINYAAKPKNLTSDQLYNAVVASFNTWTGADPNQIFNYTGETSIKQAKYDGINTILFKNIRSSAIAMTYIWYYPDSGQLAEVDTIFNKLYKWSTTAYDGTNDCSGAIGTYDLQNIGTHEFGHWIGLDDLYSNVDQDLTMYGYGETKELKKDSLGLGDITGVLAIAP